MMSYKARVRRETQLEALIGQVVTLKLEPGRQVKGVLNPADCAGTQTYFVEGYPIPIRIDRVSSISEDHKVISYYNEAEKQ